jgi:hypothetical protein
MKLCNQIMIYDKLTTKDDLYYFEKRLNGEINKIKNDINNVGYKLAVYLGTLWMVGIIIVGIIKAFF